MDEFKKYIQDNIAFEVHSMAPNPMLWQKINSNITEEKKSASVFALIKFAVAAAVIGFVIVSVFNFMNNKPTANPVVDTLNNKCYPKRNLLQDTPFKKSSKDTHSIGWINEVEQLGLCVLLKQQDDSVSKLNTVNVKNNNCEKPVNSFNNIEKQRNAVDATKHLLKYIPTATMPQKNRFSTEKYNVELQDKKYIV